MTPGTLQTIACFYEISKDVDLIRKLPQLPNLCLLTTLPDLNTGHILRPLPSSSSVDLRTPDSLVWSCST